MSKDTVVEIMNDWYDAMAKNKISVQPKASTILGTILSKHLAGGTRNIWEEALTIKGGEFAGWYSSLTSEEKNEYDEGRRNASNNYDPRQKQLLKG